MDWTLYIVENRLGALYTGICKDLSKRFDEHQSGGKRCAKALKGKAPLTLKYAAYLQDHSTALRAEMWVKKLSRTSKLQLIAQRLQIEFPHTVLCDSERQAAVAAAPAKR